MNELERYIQSYFGIAKSDLTKITSFFHTKTHDKGRFLLRKGAVCHQLSFIKSGIVRVYAEIHGKEVTQWIGTEGFFITDLAGIVFQKPSRFNIQTLTDCELYTIDRVEYESMGRVITKWHHLEKLFIARCFTMMEDRILNLLSLSAEERYQVLLENHSSLFNEVPLQYLASMMGMTPETLSRLRNKRL